MFTDPTAHADPFRFLISGAYIASRCLWDTETDNYSSFSMKNVRHTADGSTWMHSVSLLICRRPLVVSLSVLLVLRLDGVWSVSRVMFASFFEDTVFESAFSLFAI
jgi:hypothetical protein